VLCGVVGMALGFFSEASANMQEVIGAVAAMWAPKTQRKHCANAATALRVAKPKPRCKWGAPA
jgi:hypothetical protein